MPIYSRRSALSALACGLLVAPALGCAAGILGGRPIVVTKPFQAKAAVAAPLGLTVDVPIGQVKVVAEDVAEVRVDGTIGGEDQETADAVNVTLATEDGKATVKATGPSGKSWKADLNIVVPKKSGLTLTMGVGAATVVGLEGALDATVGVGDLKIEGQALTEDGTASAGTGNATINLASWSEGKSLKVNSGVGNVTVLAPDGIGFAIEGETGVGALDSKGLELDSGSKPDKTVVGASLKGRTKAEPAGRKLTAESGTGNVSIRPASPSAK